METSRLNNRDPIEFPRPSKKGFETLRPLVAGGVHPAADRGPARMGQRIPWLIEAWEERPGGQERFARKGGKFRTHTSRAACTEPQQMLGFILDTGRGRRCGAVCRRPHLAGGTSVHQGPEVATLLLRDLLGPLPFRDVRIDPAWLAWNNGTVRRLAEAAYQDRQLPSRHLDRARLGILADALEESGCDDAGFLGHLRSDGPHVRGCWAVDAVRS
jgi:hypothetical protein